MFGARLSDWLSAFNRIDILELCVREEHSFVGSIDCQVTLIYFGKFVTKTGFKFQNYTGSGKY